jgi:endonuclease YncB( thermonuclease family)
MPTNPTEQADLAVMKAKQIEIKMNAFTLARAYARMTPDEVRNCGHKTKESAVFSTIQRALKDCDEEARKFLKKWPD